jgi:hypothetical protein
LTACGKLKQCLPVKCYHAHMKSRTILSALALFILATACNSNQPDSPQEDEAKMLRLHEQSREHHLRKDARAMFEQSTDDMLSVNAGRIHKVSKEKDAAGFQQYFDAVEFRKWDDVTPPVVRFSEDRSLAYVIVDKIVVLETNDTTGTRIEETTHYAWVSIYRKQNDGNYKMECIASTNQPEQVVKL